jgi:subtilisin family serine protease
MREQADLSGQTGPQAVVTRLQSVAERTQAGAIARLRSEQAAGHVSSFQPLWALNAIIVRGDLAAAAGVAAVPGVRAIVADERVTLDPGQAAPADTPADIEWNVRAVKADRAWEQVTGVGVLVGVIDTGVDAAHPALSGRYAKDGASHAFSWLDAVADKPDPYDDNSHGTHVTGTILGAGGLGVAPGARWIAAKVLNAAGSGTSSTILPGMQWMLAPGGDPGHAPQVVSNSWGGSCTENEPEIYQPVVQAWLAAGILPVFSNGNSGPGAQSVGRPACYPESFAVGNLDYGAYSGVAIRALPAGPGPLIGLRGSGPAFPSLTAPFQFVGGACPGDPVPPLGGSIALIERGGCTFVEKAATAQAAGARAMVLYNNVEGSPPAMSLADPGIPGLSVTLADGLALRGYLSTSPEATLQVDTTTILASTPLEVPIIAASSSRGPSPFNVQGTEARLIKPDVSAPGTNVRSSVPGGGFGLKSGTSMAAPHVSGTAALVIAANSSLRGRPDLVRGVIEESAIRLGTPVPNNTFGWGAIDALAAVLGAAKLGQQAA